MSSFCVYQTNAQINPLQISWTNHRRRPTVTQDDTGQKTVSNSAAIAFPCARRRCLWLLPLPTYLSIISVSLHMLYSRADLDPFLFAFSLSPPAVHFAVYILGYCTVGRLLYFTGGTHERTILFIARHLHTPCLSSRRRKHGWSRREYKR